MRKKKSSSKPRIAKIIITTIKENKNIKWATLIDGNWQTKIVDRKKITITHSFNLIQKSITGHDDELETEDSVKVVWFKVYEIQTKTDFVCLMIQRLKTNLRLPFTSVWFY